MLTILFPPILYTRILRTLPGLSQLLSQRSLSRERDKSIFDHKEPRRQPERCGRSPKISRSDRIGELIELTRQSSERAICWLDEILLYYLSPICPVNNWEEL